MCVIQHRNWPLRSTILNEHGINASPDGLCTSTHGNEPFSCWFCCNSFSVDRARRGNVCLEDQAKACSPTDQPVRKFKDGLGYDYENFLYFPDRVIFWYPYSFDDRWREWNEAKTDNVEGRISTSIGQAERSVPDNVTGKRKKAMAVAERERVSKRDR